VHAEAHTRLLELRRRAVELDRALHHEHTVEVRGHRAQLVRHEEHRGAVLEHEVHERVAELALRLRVDARDGLVEHEQLGLARERAGDEHALLLTAGELEHRTARLGDQADRLDGVVDGGAVLRTGPPPPPRARESPRRHDLAHGDRQVGREHIALRDVPEPGALAQRARVGPEEARLTGLWREEPEEEAQQRRLPRAVRAHERGELTRAQREAHVVHDRLRAVREREVSGIEERGLDDPISVVVRIVLIPEIRVRLLAGVLVLTAFALLAAPAAGAGDAPRSVVAAFYPLVEAAERVGGRHVEVTSLTPPGVEPHDLELTPDDVDAILDADLAIVMGDGFQPAVESSADDRDGPTLVVLDQVRRSHRGDDPHVWLDPIRYRAIVDAVADALAKADPGNARTYRRNAARFRARLEALDEEFRRGLATCESRTIVTAHDAFGWLADRYELREHGIAGVDPDREPNPDRIAELADLAEERGVTTIFTEELVSPRVARTLAREAGGLRTAVLDPIEGLSDERRAAGDDYVTVMQRNLRRLRAALRCA
jgi:zinc transport system substrate-binding protein